MASVKIKSERFESYEFDPSTAVVTPYGIAITPYGIAIAASGYAGGNIFLAWDNIGMIRYDPGETQVEMSGDIWQTIFELQKDIIELKAKLDG